MSNFTELLHTFLGGFLVGGAFGIFIALEIIK